MTTYSETELAKRWGVTTRTLQQWRAKGIGCRFIRIGERSILYREEDVLAYEAASIVGKPTPPDGWETTVKRAASAIDMLAKKSATPKAKQTLEAMRDELRGLIS